MCLCERQEARVVRAPTQLRRQTLSVDNTRQKKTRATTGKLGPGETCSLRFPFSTLDKGEFTRVRDRRGKNCSRSVSSCLNQKQGRSGSPAKCSTCRGMWVKPSSALIVPFSSRSDHSAFVKVHGSLPKQSSHRCLTALARDRSVMWFWLYTWQSSHAMHSTFGHDRKRLPHGPCDGIAVNLQRSTSTSRKQHVHRTFHLFRASRKTILRVGRLGHNLLQ